MALSIDRLTNVIFVPKADLQLVQATPTEIRQLDINAFRLELKDIEDEPDGITYTDTHRHVQPISIGGVTLARVVEILEPYTITFEDGNYQVNLVGANSNIADRTNLNQVGIRSANSAGLTFSQEIENQSYNGKISIDTLDGLSGTQYPRGTPSDPVDNWTDAVTIANRLKFESFRLSHTLILPVASTLDGFTIEGSNVVDSVVVLQDGTTNSLDLVDLTFTGNCGTGYFVARRCILGTLTNFEGGLFECVLNGQITLSGAMSGTADISFMNCVSGYPGDTPFILDCNGFDGDIQFRNWSGGLVVRNFSGGGSMSIDVSQGNVTIEPSCTAGQILVRGIAQITDNSGAGCNVVDRVLFGATEQTRLKETWQRFGLDPANPLRTTTTQVTVDGITIDLTGDGVSSSTHTRQ